MSPTDNDLSAIIALAWARCLSSSTALRPPTLPRALAAVKPAYVRSCIRLRSNSANAPKT